MLHKFRQVVNQVTNLPHSTERRYTTSHHLSTFTRFACIISRCINISRVTVKNQQFVAVEQNHHYIALRNHSSECTKIAEQMSLLQQTPWVRNLPWASWEMGDLRRSKRLGNTGPFVDAFLTLQKENSVQSPYRKSFTSIPSSGLALFSCWLVWQWQTTYVVL